MKRKTFCLVLIALEIFPFLFLISERFLNISFGLEEDMIPWIILSLAFVSVLGVFTSMIHFKRNVVISIILLVLSFFLLFVIYDYSTQPVGKPKGVHSAIKATIANVRAQASLLFDENKINSYEGLCQQENVLQSLENVRNINKNNPKCFSDKDSFVVAGKLINKKSSKSELIEYKAFCADSNGIAREINKDRYNQILNADTLCN